MWWLTMTALAGTATLHVGIPKEAGTLNDVVVHGVHTGCAKHGTRLVCQADEPLQFTFGKTGFELVGDTTVLVGREGRAWVFASKESRTADVRRLRAAPTASAVRDLYVWFAGHEVSLPSYEMFRELIKLSIEGEKPVRRQAMEALQPWMAWTHLDLLPVGSPAPLPDGLLLLLAQDPDPAVRKRVMRLLRSLADPHFRDEGQIVLRSMLRDENVGVRRAAVAALPDLSSVGMFSPIQAWQVCMERVPRPLAEGRAAANAMSKLHSQRGQLVGVDPREAIVLTLDYHPERALRLWKTWVVEVPFEEELAATLFRRTIGVERKLLRTWAAQDPAGLARVLEAWRPTAGDRWDWADAALRDWPNADIQRVLNAPPPVGLNIDENDGDAVEPLDTDDADVVEPLETDDADVVEPLDTDDAGPTEPPLPVESEPVDNTDD
ncbi:MAG: hypothetical protein ACI9MC_000297 [Kiritimatiellia bacterium]|jgi:hypothetical protein